MSWNLNSDLIIVYLAFKLLSYINQDNCLNFIFLHILKVTELFQEVKITHFWIGS